MPRSRLFPFGSSSAPKTRLTVTDIGAPTDFRHVMRLRMEDVSSSVDTPYLRANVIPLPSDWVGSQTPYGAGLQADSLNLAAQGIDAIPNYQEAQIERVMTTEAASNGRFPAPPRPAPRSRDMPPPPPPRVDSLGKNTPSETPSAEFAPIPKPRRTLAQLRAGSTEAPSMPIGAPANLTDVRRVKEIAKAVNIDDKPLTEALKGLSLTIG